MFHVKQIKNIESAANSAMLCQRCNKEVLRRAPMQKYCEPCSEAQFAKRGGPRKAPSAQLSREIKRGLAISKAHSRTSPQAEPFIPDDGWAVRFKFPFSPASSKNNVWSLARGSGHVFKRKQSREYQDAVAHKVRSVIRGQKIYQNKIWIDIFVQKPNHKSDAINVVDVICDGLKIGLGVDDRWFCIRQVDWEIAKNDPQIFVGIYQRDAFDAQPCSHCGRVMSLDKFGPNKSTKNGFHRICRDCRNARKPTPAEAQ